MLCVHTKKALSSILSNIIFPKVVPITEAITAKKISLALLAVVVLLFLTFLGVMLNIEDFDNNPLT